MDTEKVRFKIISLIKERRQIEYDELVSILKIDSQLIQSACKKFRFQKHAIDIDQVGIGVTPALFSLSDQDILKNRRKMNLIFHRVLLLIIIQLK